MGTAKQLIPTFVDAQPLYWDRSYSKNMRPIRGYPDWWRIIDTEAFIDGPVTQGGQYVNDLYIWKAEILRDDNYDLTDTIEVSNLRERLTSDSSIVNGQTVYEFQYLFSEPDFSYTHTDVIDSVSLEFDQLGRRIVAFESAGDVFLIWYDTSVGDTVITNFGEGKNPVIVTDTYYRKGGSADSERFLFYVNSATNQVVYRKQNDRYGIEYSLPASSGDVVELLKVSKNLYGGLTVLYCYEDSPENLTTESFTARPGEDIAHIGTDGKLLSISNISASSASLFNFSLEIKGFKVSLIDTASLVPDNANILKFVLRSSIVELELTEPTEQAINLSITSATVESFLLETVQVEVPILLEEASFNLSITSSDVISFSLEQVRFRIDKEIVAPNVFAFDVLSSDITVFTLG